MSNEPHAMQRGGCLRCSARRRRRQKGVCVCVSRQRVAEFTCFTTALLVPKHKILAQRAAAEEAERFLCGKTARVVLLHFCTR